MEEATSAHRDRVRLNCRNGSPDGEMNRAVLRQQRASKRRSEVMPAADGEPEKILGLPPSWSKWNTFRI